MFILFLLFSDKTKYSFHSRYFKISFSLSIPGHIFLLARMPSYILIITINSLEIQVFPIDVSENFESSKKAYQIYLQDEPKVILLELSDKFIDDNGIVQYVDNQEQSWQSLRNLRKSCFYMQGYLQETAESTAAISVCDGLVGFAC